MPEVALSVLLCCGSRPSRVPVHREGTRLDGADERGVRPAYNAQERFSTRLCWRWLWLHPDQVRAIVSGQVEALDVTVPGVGGQDTVG